MTKKQASILILNGLLLLIGLTIAGLSLWTSSSSVIPEIALKGLAVFCVFGAVFCCFVFLWLAWKESKRLN